jgi:hypothetical protein
VSGSNQSRKNNRDNTKKKLEALLFSSSKETGVVS